MATEKPKRILIAPVEIAGYYRNLAEGLRLIGADCDFVPYTEHRFCYSPDSNSPFLIKAAKAFRRFGARSKHILPITLLIELFSKAFIRTWSFAAIFKYDVFIFGYGQSLWPKHNLDIWLLNILGKTVILNLAHGSEARPPYINGGYQSPDGFIQPSPEFLYKKSKRIRSKVQFLCKHAKYIIGAPFSTSQFAETKLVNIFHLGTPVSFATSYQKQESSDRDDHSENNLTVRILHSPSHSAAKGSVIIEEAIKNLKRKGYQIDLVIIQDQPNAEVIRQIRRCDMVVDQIYSDTPMAAFATEAAYFGKPTVVAGYRLEELRRFVPDELWPPSMVCHPDHIESAIESMITDRGKRYRIGAAAQKFIQQRWHAAEVAKRYLKIIEGNIPEDWWFDPRDIEYLEGFGQSIELSRRNISLLVKTYGTDSLQLTHRPKLETSFLEFAQAK